MGSITCRIGFAPRHMVKHAAQYDGALAQVTCVLSDDAETCDLAEQRLFHRNKGFALRRSSPPCRGLQSRSN